MYIDFLQTHHKKTKRNYLERVNKYQRIFMIPEFRNYNLLKYWNILKTNYIVIKQK